MRQEDYRDPQKAAPETAIEQTAKDGDRRSLAGSTGESNIERTFWSPKWSRTRDHGSVLNGTDRHARPIFAIQINPSRDRTKRAETATNKFRVRCFQPLSALSMAAHGLIGFVRRRARPPNVGMIVGSGRWNANHIMISMGLGGHSLRQRIYTPSSRISDLATS
jgi:hypothetical protein